MKDSKFILFLVNPFSGNGNGVKVAKQAKLIVENNGFYATLFVSESKAHLCSFIHNFEIESISKIAIIGGDGTMHDVVNSMMQKPEWLSVPLLLFPCGTGNAFNYDMDCLTNQKATQLLMNGTPTLIDLAEIITAEKSVWSFNIIGCGLVADINLLAEKLRWFGPARYNLASIYKIFFNRSINAKINFNDKEINANFCFLLACNTKFTGKAMKMAPLAVLDDGLIDLLIVRKTSKLKLLALFPKVFSGKHLSSPILEYVQTSHLKISTKNNELVNIDGEIKGSTPLEIIVHKQKLKIIR